jgi:hypothetical protein
VFKRQTLANRREGLGPPVLGGGSLAVPENYNAKQGFLFENSVPEREPRRVIHELFKYINVYTVEE